MKTLLSLFDYTGTWSDPFRWDGWQVFQMDIKHGYDIMKMDSVEYIFEELQLENVDGIIGAPPCTAYSVSGAKHWKTKYAEQDTLFGKYDPVEVYDKFVEQTLKAVDLFIPTDPEFGESEGETFFWAIENPVGRIAKRFPTLLEFGQPMFFDPYEFAGYLNPSKKVLKELDRIRLKNGKDVTNDEAELIYSQEVYTKKTGLWGDFNRDLIKKPIAPVNGAKTGSVLQRAGGTSNKTKEFRSKTPEGFAQAFCDAQQNYRGKWYERNNGIEY